MIQKFLIQKIPWKTLGVFTLGIIIGLYLGANGAVKVIAKIFETETVAGAINKPTQTTTTHNKVEIKKLKTKHSDSVSFSFKPATIQKPIQKPVEIINNDSCDYYMNLIKKLRPGQLKRLKNKKQ